jgi:hypothetical protein
LTSSGSGQPCQGLVHFDHGQRIALTVGEKFGRGAMSSLGDHPSGTPSFSGPGSSAVLPFEPPTKTKPAAGGLRSLQWTGEVPSQKWMNFYSRVLSKFATGSGLRVTVKVEIAPEGGVSEQKVEETRSALRELGLHDVLDKDV